MVIREDFQRAIAQAQKGKSVGGGISRQYTLKSAPGIIFKGGIRANTNGDYFNISVFKILSYEDAKFNYPKQRRIRFSGVNIYFYPDFSIRVSEDRFENNLWHMEIDVYDTVIKNHLLYIKSPDSILSERAEDCIRYMLKMEAFKNLTEHSEELSELVQTINKEVARYA